MLDNLPDRVRIVEVGPRDGLQNEPNPLCVDARASLIEDLMAAGLEHIEIGAFVSPKWVPQMAGTSELVNRLPSSVSTTFAALVPNMKGLEAAIKTPIDEIAVFTAASESFTQMNINCSIQQSLERFAPVIDSAKTEKLRVRGYVSCVIACPYEGPIEPKRVADVACQLGEMGCDEISLGDTLGVGTPLATQSMLSTVSQSVPVERLALHAHDTYGQALANVVAALGFGVCTFDTSVAGLGGCPYAPGASGNLATEDLVFMLDGMGIDTGIDLDRLFQAGEKVCRTLGRQSPSKVARALGSKAKG